MLAISNHELYLFLKEKAITDGTEMAAQADLFADARGGSQQVVVRESRQKDRSMRDSNTDNSRRQFNSLPRQGNNSSNHWKCNHCGGDHRSFDCRRRGNKQMSAAIDDRGEDKVVANTETGSGNTFYKHPNYRGKQYSRGRGMSRGLGR